MKKVIKKYFFLALAIIMYSCNEDEKYDILERYTPETITSDEIAPVLNLQAQYMDSNSEIVLVTWMNPEDDFLSKVEISCCSANDNLLGEPILLDAVSTKVGSYQTSLSVEERGYVKIVAINEKGVRSEARTAEILSSQQDFVYRADCLMSSVIELFFGGRYNAWNENYPNATGPYWDGIAAVWGQGAAYSVFVTMYKVAKETNNEKLRAKYAEKEETFLNSIDLFLNNGSGRKSFAYGTYIGPNDERYYDDNVWIGIEMANLYELTGNEVYLQHANTVWNFILEGIDDVTGGGVYWKEGAVSKHTCSTAPAAVMALKLYQLSKNESYLEIAKSLYSYCKDVVQDPNDYLFYDNVRLSDPSDKNSELKVSKDKFTYNSGQPMLAAAMLYRITKEEQFLKDAQNIAQSIYKKWFKNYHSSILDRDIMILSDPNTWFNAVMFRGFVELYKIDKNDVYVKAVKNTMEHAWQSNCRNRLTNLMSDDYAGDKKEGKWNIKTQGAFVEIFSLIGELEQLGCFQE